MATSRFDNPALDSGGQFHEGAEVHDPGDGAADVLADGEHVDGFLPGVTRQLFHSQADPAALGVDSQDLDLDRLPLGQHLIGMIQP